MTATMRDVSKVVLVMWVGVGLGGMARAQTTSSAGTTQTVVETTEVPADREAEPVAVAKPVAPEAPVTDQALNLKLRDIEQRVNELKEKIFQSKARLIQLQEVVLHGAISGAKAVLVHRNEMGSSFVLRRVQYALDGAMILNRVDETGTELSDREEIEVFNGSIAPGNHQISVYLEYQGHGYGVFSYLKGYRFKIKSSYTFNAEEGKLTTVKIVGHEKGGITTELKDRPAVRYDVESTQALRPPTSEADAASQPKAE